MCEWFLSLPIDTRVIIITSIVTGSVAIITLLIAVITLLQNSKIMREANRPNVMIYLETTTILSFRNKYIVIKNFGNTAAKIDTISCSRDIDFCHNLNPFADLTNFTIAPNQSIVTSCDFKRNKSPFTFTIFYSHKNRKFEETCYINPNTTTNLLHGEKSTTGMNQLEKTILNSAESLIKSRL